MGDWHLAKYRMVRSQDLLRESGLGAYCADVVDGESHSDRAPQNMSQTNLGTKRSNCSQGWFLMEQHRSMNPQSRVWKSCNVAKVNWCKICECPSKKASRF